MANDYFVWTGDPGRIADSTTARGAQINNPLDALETGLNKLPTEAQNNRGTRNYIATDTGVVNAYAGALSHVTGAYADGQEVDILIGATNTSATPTLNVSGISDTVIKTPGANTVPIGALAANSIARLKYNATLVHWELLGVYDITSTVSAFMATVLVDTTAEAARATLGDINRTVFTPNIYGGTVAGTPVFTGTSYYSRTGNIMLVTVEILLSSHGGASGTVIIKIPGITAFNCSHQYATVSYGIGGITANTNIFVSGSGTGFSIGYSNPVSVSSGISWADLSANSLIYFNTTIHLT